MRWLVCLICCSLAVGCTDKYPDYEKVGHNLYLQLLAFDYDQEEPENCDVYEIYLNISDSVLQSEIFPKPKDNLPNWLTSGDDRLLKMENYLNHLRVGDSAVFIHEGLAAPDSAVIIHLSWKACYTTEEFEAVYNAWRVERADQERGRVREFSKNNGFTPSIVHPEVLYRLEKSGMGKALNYGDEITIRYSGHFLNGNSFDQADSTSPPLVFKLGTEGQVLRGMEYGLIGATPGEIRSVVFSSEFGFGENGSSTGIVPPYTPVWYKVEVLPLPVDSLS